MASFIAGGEDKPQAATKESPTLIQAITELLGIPIPLVLRIKSGEYDDLRDLLPKALEWEFKRLTENSKKRRGRERISLFPQWLIHHWHLQCTWHAVAVPFNSKLASPGCIHGKCGPTETRGSWSGVAPLRQVILSGGGCKSCTALEPSGG